MRLTIVGVAGLLLAFPAIADGLWGSTLIGKDASQATVTPTGSGTPETVAQVAATANAAATYNYATFSNADFSMSASNRTISQTGTMSAARTVNLTAASALAAGTVPVTVVDKSGTVTSTNYIHIVAAGADTINGGTSVDIKVANGSISLSSDGVSAWQIINNATLPGPGASQMLMSDSGSLPIWETPSGDCLAPLGVFNCFSVTPVSKAKGGTGSTTGSGAAVNLSLAYVLCQSNTITSHTGDTNEFSLATCTVPANTLGSTTGKLSITMSGTLVATNGGVGGVTYKVRYGASNNLSGSACYSQNNTASGNTGIKIDTTLRPNASTSAQKCGPNQAASGYANSSNVSPAVDETATSYIVFSCQLNTSASDSCGIDTYSVIYYPPPGN